MTFSQRSIGTNSCLNIFLWIELPNCRQMHALTSQSHLWIFILISYLTQNAVSRWNYSSLVARVIASTVMIKAQASKWKIWYHEFTSLKISMILFVDIFLEWRLNFLNLNFVQSDAMLEWDRARSSRMSNYGRYHTKRVIPPKERDPLIDELWKEEVGDVSSGLILGLCPANERRRYKVTPSLIGWAQT